MRHPKEHLHKEALQKMEVASDLDALHEVYRASIGAKGWVSELISSLRSLDAKERRELASIFNTWKSELRDCFEQRRSDLSASSRDSTSADVTVPCGKVPVGYMHPITSMMEKVVEIFRSMGFKVFEGTEIDDEKHNFDMLNFSPHHPARQDHDTFFLGGDKLMRTHTSPSQVRALAQLEKPFKIITIGRVYRRDKPDSTHMPVFHQLEGMWVEDGLGMSELLGCLKRFLNILLGEREIRIRPSYFPFTTPSIEIDVMMGNEWVEILGAGAVHPNVLGNYANNALAWGVGIERLVMMCDGLESLPDLYQNDVRFLSHYGLHPCLA